MTKTPSLYRTAKTRRLLILLGAGIFLSACTSNLEDTLKCPGITVLDDTRTLTRMASPGSANAAFVATVLGAAGTCEYDLDDRTKTGMVEAEIAVTFAVSRGVALKSNVAAFDYYVAVTDSFGGILNKIIFPVQVTLPTGKNGATMKDDPLTLIIPLKTSAQATGAYKKYHIVVGLQLSPSELDYNQKRKSP